MMKNPQYEIFTSAVEKVLFPARTKLNEHKEDPVPIDRGTLPRDQLSVPEAYPPSTPPTATVKA